MISSNIFFLFHCKYICHYLHLIKLLLADVYSFIYDEMIVLYRSLTFINLIDVYIFSITGYQIIKLLALETFSALILGRILRCFMILFPIMILSNFVFVILFCVLPFPVSRIYSSSGYLTILHCIIS